MRAFFSGIRTVLIASAFVVVSCAHRQKAAPAGEFLRLAGRDDVPTLDPAIGYDTTSWMFEDAIFNTLLDYDDESRLVGELAREWWVSADGRTYTFRLRPNVTFHNGRTLTAGDVKYSIQRVLDPATRSQGAEFFRGLVGSDGCRHRACEISGVEVPDRQTVVFRLAAPDPLFAHKLAMQFAAVVPREEVERWGEDFARHAIGSGPFRLLRWERGVRLILARNRQYYKKGLPKVAGVDYLIGLDDDLAWFKYEAGELDVAAIPPAEFPRVMREGRYRPLLRRVVSMTTIYLGMNCSRPPFDNRRVRQAMNYAVDKEKILRLINNRGVKARGFLPPTMPGSQSTGAGYPHDVKKARHLLQQAGYGGGFETTLWVRADDDALRLAQAVQQDLREIGVRIEVRALAWAPFLDAVKRGDRVPFFQLGWQADFPDPSNFLETLLHSKNRGSNNSTFFSDSRVDALLDKAGRELDPSVRLRALQTAEQRAIREAPWVFLYHPVTYVLVSSRVHNYRLHPLRPPRFERVWLDLHGN